MPGVDRDLHGVDDGERDSTAGDAMLSVADPSPTATGRLVNGAFSLREAVRRGRTPARYAPVGGSADPTTLLTYTGPTSANAVTLGFKQRIGAARGAADRRLQQDADVHAAHDESVEHSPRGGQGSSRRRAAGRAVPPLSRRRRGAGDRALGRAGDGRAAAGARRRADVGQRGLAPARPARAGRAATGPSSTTGSRATGPSSTASASTAAGACATATGSCSARRRSRSARPRTPTDSTAAIALGGAAPPLTEAQRKIARRALPAAEGLGLRDPGHEPRDRRGGPPQRRRRQGASARGLRALRARRAAPEPEARPARGDRAGQRNRPPARVLTRGANSTSG